MNEEMTDGAVRVKGQFRWKTERRRLFYTWVLPLSFLFLAKVKVRSFVKSGFKLRKELKPTKKVLLEGEQNLKHVSTKMFRKTVTDSIVFFFIFLFNKKKTKNI